MSFKKDDRVRITAKTHSKFGELGTVNHIYTDGGCLVQLDTGNRSAFFKDEVELVDEKREALIELAETLDKARKQANAIEDYTIASEQEGVYGQIKLALLDTLEVITDDAWKAGRVYGSAMEDGNTIREALKAVEK